MLHTFAAMELQMSHIEAWNNFFEWIKDQPTWSKMGRREKQYLYKTKKAAADGSLGPERIERILKQYAPDRYEFRSVVIVHE